MPTGQYTLQTLPVPAAALCLPCADGSPLVVSNPAGPVGTAFMDLGATVVREVAKLSTKHKHGVVWDEQQHLLRVVLPAPPGSSPSAPFFLEPAVVRRHDTSARSLNEWTGESLGAGDVPNDVKPLSIALVGNYAVQITWDDGFNQVGAQTAHQGCRCADENSCVPLLFRQPFPHHVPCTAFATDPASP